MINKFSGSSFSSSGWWGATIGVFFAALFLGGLSTWDLLNRNVSMGEASTYFAAGALITALIGAALVGLWLCFFRLPLFYKWAIACFAFLVYYFFLPSQTISGVAFLAFWILLSFSLIGGGLGVLFSRLKNRHATLNWIYPALCIFLGLIGIALLFFFWFITDQDTFKPPSNLEGSKTIPPIPLPNPASPGPLDVTFLSYGNSQSSLKDAKDGENFISAPTVNAQPFIKNWNGLEGWLRTAHWGFDARHLPLRGRVWYLQGSGPFPLVLIVHGNHEMTASSEQGYDYLGQLLASRGFMTVSIDENFLNGSWGNMTNDLGEVPARGWLILEHLKLWRTWNESERHRFFKKVDMDKIALIGHSRGGEAIATATAFNQLNT